MSNINENENGYVVVVDSLPIKDEGTIVVFRGVSDTDEDITFGVDHRMAQDIIDALGRDGEDATDFIYAYVEDWQILSRCPNVTIDTESSVVMTSVYDDDDLGEA